MRNQYPRARSAAAHSKLQRNSTLRYKRMLGLVAAMSFMGNTGLRLSARKCLHLAWESGG